MTEKELYTTLFELLSLPAETECVEFKEAKTNYDFSRIGKYFSALCNEANLNQKSCSWLLFGINDKTRTIVNTQFRPQRNDLDSLKSEIAKPKWIKSLTKLE